ncbi:hypothetical protein XELAEV_18007245mg [Xenopus laevis]|uniref:Ig-like domain-containing protein n=1 Tax=Xenopus laevis TaxID=8355 RepID=A0A974E0S4_XENLA|nr:hypothetical protein XELAEV_18007245mg [Xenopus laevis]
MQNQLAILFLHIMCFYFLTILIILSSFYIYLYPDVNCQEVTQVPHSARAVEGSRFNMTCEYKSNLYTLQWYKQVPGKMFQFLRIQRVDEEITEDRFVFRLQKEKQLSTLSIKQVEVSDSATYWCALEAQC